MMGSSSLTLLSAASLLVAALHVIYNLIMGGVTRSAWRGVTFQREEIRVARVRQMEAEQQVAAARQRLDALQDSETQLERSFDDDTDEKLRFQITVGRAAPGLSSFRGRVDRRGDHHNSRDMIVWAHSVVAVVWAESMERASTILADAYPNRRGYSTAVEMPLPGTIDKVASASPPNAR